MTLNWPMIGLACLGGLLPDGLRLVKTLRTETGPIRTPAPRVLLSILLQVLIGGLAAFIMQSTSAKEAIALGFAGPQFLTTALSAAVPAPKNPPGEGSARKLASTKRVGLVGWWRV